MNKILKWTFGLFVGFIFIFLCFLNVFIEGVSWVWSLVFMILITPCIWGAFLLLDKLDKKMKKHSDIHGGFMGYVCPKCKNRLKVTEHGTQHVDYDCVICGWHKDKKI